MPKIIKNDAQLRACEYIAGQLDQIKTMNQAILSQDTASFTVSFGRKKSFGLDAIYNEKLAAILKQQRTKKIKEILAKAAKFHIELEDDDRALISDSAITPTSAGATEE